MSNKRQAILFGTFLLIFGSSVLFMIIDQRHNDVYQRKPHRRADDERNIRAGKDIAQKEYRQQHYDVYAHGNKDGGVDGFGAGSSASVGNRSPQQDIFNKGAKSAEY